MPSPLLRAFSAEHFRTIFSPGPLAQAVAFRAFGADRVMTAGHTSTWFPINLSAEPERLLESKTSERFLRGLRTLK